WNHSSRTSATPSLLVSANFQMLGGAATYTEPSYHKHPSGNISLSANTMVLSKRPSPSVSSRRTNRCGLSWSCFSGLSFEPEESTTYNRPWSSKEPYTGRSASGGPATNSTSKPSGTVIV